MLRRGYREDTEASPANEAARSVAKWMAATAEERGRALVDLLLLADALPSGGRRASHSDSPRSTRVAIVKARREDPASIRTEPSRKVIVIHEALSEAKIPYALGGALALAYYAEPRATIDIDVNVFVSPERWREVVARLEPLGVDSSGLDSRALERDGQCRLWWGRTPIDLFFSNVPIHEEMPKRARRLPFGGRALPFVAPEHLAVFKAMFDRPKDWVDIEQMVIAGDELNAGEMEQWLERMVGDGDPRLTLTTPSVPPPPPPRHLIKSTAAPLIEDNPARRPRRRR